MQHDSLIPWSRRQALLGGLAALGARMVAAVDDAPSVRILFLGNRYSAFNRLPAVVGELMLSSGMLAPHIGSYLQEAHTLADHAADAAALSLLKKGAEDGKPWDVLVVQEQSILSAVAAVNPAALQLMNSGLAKLVAAAREANPQMLIVNLQVWARHESLWKKQSPDALSTGRDANEAHARIRLANVNTVSAALQQNPGMRILVSPVGDFWRLVHAVHPALALHAADGSHPDLLGSLLAGLVIVGTIGGREVMEHTTWRGECPFDEVERVKKVLLDHPEVFKAAGK